MSAPMPQVTPEQKPLKAQQLKVAMEYAVWIVENEPDKVRFICGDSYLTDAQKINRVTDWLVGRVEQIKSMQMPHTGICTLSFNNENERAEFLSDANLGRKIKGEAQ